MTLRLLILGWAVLSAAAVPGLGQTSTDRTSRFQVEIFGFGTTLRENSINKAVEFQSNRQSFFYNTYLTYLYTTSVLSSWKETVDGAWKGFETAFPLGARVKYNISDHIILSIGAERLGTKATTSLAGAYVRTYTDATSDQISLEFKPYELSIDAWAPLLGVHIYEPAKENWAAEGGVLIGPLFGRVVSESTWLERGVAATFNETSPRLDTGRTTQGTTRMEGTGLGFCLEVEGKLSYFLGRGFGIFAGVNIGFRTVPKLSGPGREVRDGITTEWDSEWALKTTTIARTWETLTSEYPSNDWTTDPTAVRSGKFNLDLSGIWLGGGVFVRF